MAIYSTNEFLKMEDFREARDERKRKISIVKCVDHPVLLYFLPNFFFIVHSSDIKTKI